MNKSKRVGTEAETAVVSLLRSRGFDSADRIPLKGVHDCGDVDLYPGSKTWMCEVKSGHAAEAASIQQIQTWMADTERERVAGGYANGFLVVKRKGYGKDRAFNWTAYMDLVDFLRMLNRDQIPTVTFPISMQLGALLTLIREVG